MTHEHTVTITLPEECRKYVNSAWASIAEHLRQGGYGWMAESIAEQLKPLVPRPIEPTAFGSIVSARGPWMGARHPEPIRWQKTPMHGKHYWESETGAVEVWPELTDVEVLRVGLGAEPVREPLNEQEVRDVATAVLSAMDVDQYLIDAVANARPR